MTESTGSLKSEEQLQEMIAETETGARNPTGAIPKKILFYVPLIWTLFQLWYASPLPFIFNIGVFNSTEARARVPEGANRDFTSKVSRSRSQRGGDGTAGATGLGTSAAGAGGDRGAGASRLRIQPVRARSRESPVGRGGRHAVLRLVHGR